MKLDGKIAFVAGGASGIGLATAAAFVQAGAVVYIADVNKAAGEVAAADLGRQGGTVKFVHVDITSQEAVDRARDAVVSAHGAADILVIAAGWSSIQPFADTTPELWQKLIDLNYVGTLRLSQAFLPGMRERGRGKIVNVASDAGRVGSGGEAVYSGAKGAVIAFTKALARESARYSINVNCVCPGPTDTPLLASVPEKHREALVKAIPFRRFAKPSEVADAILFFASGRSDYLTGQVLSVSGGLTMAD
ncbi:MAG: SDR family NAD(P)-dependent oxidoreductase [Burkholderiales bacterium]|nr:SDR family NAD(P)-dependent oxidoreductase [Burkholderiales bacterium]